MEGKAEERAKRKEAVILRLLKGEPLKEVLLDYPDVGLKPSSWSRLKKRYEKEGPSALVDRRKGLPYKLAPEVREFIISTKGSDPRLSCMDLVAEVEAKYGVNLSKSYINEILRETGIGGLVGRPPKEVKAFEAKVEEAKVEEIKIEEAKVKEVKVEKVEPAFPIKEAEAVHHMEYAGAFFLKGADLDMLGSHTMTRVIEELARSRGNLLEERLLNREALQNMNQQLLYLPLFGVERVEDLAPSLQESLALLIGTQKLHGSQVVDRYLKTLESLGPSDSLSGELNRCFIEALGIKVTLQDRASFYIDGCLKTLWPDKEIPNQLSVALNKAKSYVSRFFLNSSWEDPMIFSICPGYIHLSCELFDLVEGFNALQSKAIVEVSIIGPNGTELESYKDLQPKLKRYFIAYLSPWQQRALGEVKIKRDFVDWKTDLYPGRPKIADGQITMIDRLTHRESLVRAALIKEEDIAKAIITNITDQELPDVGEVASAYFRRWPNHKERTFSDVVQERVKEKPQPLPMEELRGTFTLKKLFRSLLENLNRYTQNRYFAPEYRRLGIDEMTKLFYRQKGCVEVEEGAIKVTLDPSKDPEIQRALRYACRRFNESDARGPEGQRLYLHSG